jgi:hypothetical protein
MTDGLLLFAGDAGVVLSALGAAGAVESSTYAMPVEQPDTLPAASVAVALYVVELSSATETARPVEVNEPAVPVAAAAPEQSLDV